MRQALTPQVRIAQRIVTSLMVVTVVLMSGCDPRADDAVRGPETVQIDLGSLLTSRLIVTTNQGMLVLPSPDQTKRPHPAVMITEQAAALAQVTCRALPDSALFPATADHPEVTLPYGIVGLGMQVRMSEARTDTYSIPVPLGRYTTFQLYLLSNNGRTPLTVVLHYADGSVDSRTTTVMDWFNPPGASDPGWIVLVGNLGKVTAKATLAERDHHNINGFNCAPDAAKTLTLVDVTKNASGTELFLFGATGVRTASAPGTAH